LINFSTDNASSTVIHHIDTDKRNGIGQLNELAAKIVH
jgi:hypothetical protein